MTTYGYLNTSCLFCGILIRWESGVWHPASSPGTTGDPTCWNSGTKTHVPQSPSWVPMPESVSPVAPAPDPICLACGYYRDTAAHELGCLPFHEVRAENCSARRPNEASFPDEWCGTCS